MAYIRRSGGLVVNVRSGHGPLGPPGGMKSCLATHCRIGCHSEHSGESRTRRRSATCSSELPMPGGAPPAMKRPAGPIFRAGRAMVPLRSLGRMRSGHSGAGTLACHAERSRGISSSSARASTSSELLMPGGAPLRDDNGGVAWRDFHTHGTPAAPGDRLLLAHAGWLGPAPGNATGRQLEMPRLRSHEKGVSPFSSVLVARRAMDGLGMTIEPARLPGAGEACRRLGCGGNRQPGGCPVISSGARQSLVPRSGRPVTADAG